MNYSSFRFRAVVDWIEVEIQTGKTTNRQTVQRAFNEALRLAAGLNIWTEPRDANEGGGASCFSVRIHDVERYTDIDRLLKEVGAKLSLSPGFKINKIELALDAYCDDPATQAARFYKFMTHPVSDNRRMYHDQAGTVKAMPRTSEAIARHLSEGWQIGIGNRTDERYQHIYFKTTDTHQGERQEVEHCARIEVRLSGAALPCQAHDDWRQFKFETLAQYFRFTKLKDSLEPLIQTVAEAQDQIGERRARKRNHEGRESGTRLHSRATQADTELNSKARNALRELSARWKGTGKRGRSSRTTAATCCGNTGGIDEPNPHEHKEGLTNSNNYIYEQEGQHIVSATDLQLNPLEATGRGFDRSNESAKPIHSDQASNAIEEVIQQYEATPEAKNEHDRIDELMEVVVGDAYVSCMTSKS